MAEAKHDSKYIVEIDNLKKTYVSGDVSTSVLHGVDLKIKAGEFWAFSIL